jgi:hypothetical protein
MLPVLWWRSIKKNGGILVKEIPPFFVFETKK